MWLLIAPSSNRNKRGLTLVELVLAFSLFTFLMASVSHLVLTSLRVQRAWGQTVRPIQAVEHAFTRLAQDLHAAQPFFGVPFRGNADGAGVELARVGQGMDLDGGRTTEWIRVLYRFEPIGEGVGLVREEWAWSDGSMAGPPRRRETLTRLARGQWMFGRLTTEGQVELAPSWEGTAAEIPRLVQVDCTLPAVEGRAALTISRVFQNLAGSLPEEPVP